MEKVAFLKHKLKESYLLGTSGNSELVYTLPSGLYIQKFEYTGFNGNTILEPAAINKDLIKIDKEPYLTNAREIVKFFEQKNKELYRDLKIRHFIAALFHGAPGSGKTCFIQTVTDTLITKYNSIAIILHNDMKLYKLPDLIQQLRNNSEQHITIICDEFDKFDGLTSSTFLGFLDGIYTQENVCFLATTNRFSKLSDQLTRRKSRFSIVQEISYAPLDIVEKFLNSLITDKYKEIVKISEVLAAIDGKGVTLDDIKYIALEMIKNSASPEQAVKNLDSIKPKYNEPKDNDLW